MKKKTPILMFLISGLLLALSRARGLPKHGPNTFRSAVA